MRILAILILLAAPLGAGCVGPFADLPDCPPPSVITLSGPLTPEGLISRSPAPIAEADVLVWGRNQADFAAEVSVSGTADNGSAAPGATLLGGGHVAPGNSTFAWLQHPSRSAAGEPAAWSTARATLYSADECGQPGAAEQALAFTEHREGERTAPGNGALVYTAGFWRTNGTLFYTNMDRVHNDTRFDRAGWYEYGGGEPLPVFVYNSTREEMPPRYAEAGYVTTIEGFNEALKSMVTTAGAVADIPPEKAYTKPEYAGDGTTPPHSLYGDAIVFWIEVVDVTQVPCPLLTGPLCEAPESR